MALHFVDPIDDTSFPNCAILHCRIIFLDQIGSQILHWHRNLLLSSPNFPQFKNNSVLTIISGIISTLQTISNLAGDTTHLGLLSATFAGGWALES
jgi:hypothetical protein